MSRFILVATTLALAVAGCDRFPDNGLQIAAMLEPDDNCELSTSSRQLAGGTYDVSLPTDYMIAPLLWSYLISNALEFQAEPANLQVNNFELTLLLPDGSKIDVPGPNPYSEETSAFLAANRAAQAHSQAWSVAIGIPVVYQDALRAIAPAPGDETQRTTILLDIRAIGTTVGGFTQTSARFRWPIALCNGCLSRDVCTQDQADAGSGCFPGQDGNYYCESISAPPATP